MVKDILRDLIPPILLRVLRSVRKSGKHAGGATQFVGNYASWDEVRNHSTGYDAEKILTKVRDASLKVKAGEAAYERDGAIFDKLKAQSKGYILREIATWLFHWFGLSDSYPCCSAGEDNIDEANQDNSRS